MNPVINGSQFINNWGAKPASMIGSGARPMFMIGWEAQGQAIMCQAPKRRHTVQLDDEGSNKPYKKPNSQRCPYGLTMSQKRRVQQLRQLE
jgi:hypothetical protein